MLLKDLREKRIATLKSVEDLADKMNAPAYMEDAADAKAYDDGLAEIKALDAKIDRAVALDNLKGVNATPVPGQVSAVERNQAVEPSFVRYSKLAAFRGKDAERNAYKAGQFILATMFKREEAKSWCVENGMAINLKAQAEGANSAGGFLVPTEFENTIIDLREDYGVFRGSVGVTPMGSDSMSIPRRAGGVTAYFVAENAQLTESQKGWGQIALAAKKLGALVRMSTELSDDAVINIADDLAQEIAYAFAVKEDDCGWNGDGTSTYGGILGVKKSFEAGLDSFVGAVNAASGVDTFAEVTATDLANVMGVCPKYAIRDAKWYVSQPGWAVVFQRLLQASGGTTMTEAANGFKQLQYMGYPIMIDQTLPTTVSTINNTPMLYFGDLRKAVTMGERRGIRIKTSDDRYFEYDQIGIQGTERFDINVHDIGSASAAGPLVALMGNT